MTHIRWAGIPIDHLVAEIAAFPLASEAALRLGITELNPWLLSDQGTNAPSPTAKLWRAAENSLTAHAPNVSLDELVAMRDRAWFHEVRHEDFSRQPMHLYLETLATRHLRVRGRTAVPCLQLDRWHDGLDADALSKLRSREAWRWLTFALPPDLLLASLGRDGPMPTRVETLSPPLEESLLRRGFAESHLHVGAGLEFPLLWVSAMHGMKCDRLAETAFASPGAELQEGRELGGWLLRAAIARFFLAAYLKDRLAFESDGLTFRQYFEERQPDLLNELGSGTVDVLQDALCDLDRGQFSSPASHAELRDCYSQLTWLSHVPFPSRPYPSELKPVLPSDRPRLGGAFAADPIAVFFRAGGDEAPTPDMQFFAEGLRYADTANQRSPKSQQTRDPEFLSLFWQATRVRCLFYRHVVQRPMTPGLQWFTRTYDRLSPGRHAIGTGLKLESAALTSGFGRGLRALEIRTCSENSSSDLLELVDDFDQQFQWQTAARRDARSESATAAGVLNARDDCELGIVLHLAKDRGGGARQGLPNGYWMGSHADPSTTADERLGQRSVANPTGFRYAAYYQSTIRPHAQSFANLLQGFPLSLSVLRGIDVCTDELGVPTWVVAPAFRYLRDVSSQVSSWLNSRCHLNVPPLRTTVHAGEDFTHLLSGLRNIAWAIRYLGLREGDRIGHGVALGVNATVWAKSAGRIAVMCEERLFDLVFEWHCYATEQIAIADNRRIYLDREIARLSQFVFGRAVPPMELETLVELLHDENLLTWVGFPDGQSRPVDSLARKLEFPESIRPGVKWLKRYLTGPDVFRRGRVLEWLDPAGEAEVLERLQDFLRQRVGRQGLAIEANVSSNLLVANLGSLVNHPLWRLSPPQTLPNLQPLSVVFGSDDPITFASNLPNEFALVRDALVSGGLTDDQANSWLDHVRETGLMYRFTIPRLNFATIRDLIRYSDSSLVSPLL